MKYFSIVLIAMLAMTGCGGAEERKAAYLEKAQLSMEAGDFDKARIELKNVLQIDPKHEKAYFMLGNLFDQKKEYAKAFRNFSKVLELNPDNLESHAKIGRYHLILSKDFEKTNEIIDLILDKDNENVSGLLLRAGVLAKQNNIVAAKKISKDIFSKKPDHIENAVFLSSIYLLEREYDDSINVLNAAIKNNPNNRNLRKILASTYFSAGKLELAEAEYKFILEQNSDVFLNHSILSMFYLRTNNAEEAELVLRNAIDLKKDDEVRKLSLVNLIRNARGNQAAIKELTSLVKMNPEMGELRLALGKFYFAENQMADAEGILKSAVDDFSEEQVGIKSRVALAYLYLKNKNIDSAVSIIDQASKISSNDVDVIFFKAKLLLVKEDYEGAIIEFRTVIKDSPENVEAYILLSTAYKVNGDEHQASEIINRAYENNRMNAKALIKLARYHAKENDDAKLEKIVDNYLSMDAENYEALSFKSNLLNKKGMFSDAKPYALKLLDSYPDKINGYIESAPYIQAEKGDEALIAFLEEGYKKIKDNSRILELLISVRISVKDFDKAENTVRQAILAAPKSAALQMLLAKVQIAAGDLNASETSLINAIKIKSDWNEPYLLLAYIYTTNKESKKATDILLEGIAELKSDLKLTLTLAKIYEDMGDYDAAIGEYEKVYEVYSSNIVLINNLAMLLAEYRNDESSLKRAKNLADKLANVEDSLVLDTVGWVYYKAGHYAEAVNVLKTVVDKSPDVEMFNYHLGMALYKIGDVSAAKTYLTRSLSKNTDFAGKEEAQIQLQKLQ